MRILKETTLWSGNTPNHIYIFNDSMSKIIAYVPLGSRQVFKFKEPLPFDRNGRTFEEVEDSPESTTQVVLGSKGQRYYLSEGEAGWQCSCPGFQFRSVCKHVTEATAKSA